MRQTTFILGAGASSDFGLPLGGGLKERIRNLLTAFVDPGGFNRQGSFFQAVRNLGLDNAEIMRAAQIVRGAVGHSLSIDDFLKDFQADDTVVRLCRLAIADCMLAAESLSGALMQLSRDSVDDRATGFTVLASTWLAVLFQQLKRGVKPDSASEALARSSFIVFNYDRCLEQYLLRALADGFGLSPAEAAGLLAERPVRHVYGSLGDLPYQLAADHPVAFGDQADADIAEVASRIKTYGEGAADAEFAQSMVDVISESENIVFLGYAFHQQGMELLFPTGVTADQKVFGTAMGVHPGVLQDVHARLSQSPKRVLPAQYCIGLIQHDLHWMLRET